MGQTTSLPSTSAPSSCPIQHTPANASSPAQCPIQHDTRNAPPPPSSAPAQCPIDHASLSSSSSSLNPLNQMPDLPQSLALNQQAVLPMTREASSIPRADTSGTWDYPSPQQFHNALVRKGWETPEEHVETMVQIHNFLNEEAWHEILKWERRENPTDTPHLARFKGRPGELSPKARLYLFAGWLLPSRFNTEPPFDRHDWVVRRRTGDEVRYVIDYYSAPPLPDGSPVFSLDVRPALDSVSCVRARATAAAEEAWEALTGRQVGAARERERSV